MSNTLFMNFFYQGLFSCFSVMWLINKQTNQRRHNMIIQSFPCSTKSNEKNKQWSRDKEKVIRTSATALTGPDTQILSRNASRQTRTESNRVKEKQMDSYQPFFSPFCLTLIPSRGFWLQLVNVLASTDRKRAGWTWLKDLIAGEREWRSEKVLRELSVSE